MAMREPSPWNCELDGLRAGTTCLTHCLTQTLRVKGRALLEHLVHKSSTTDAEVSALLAQLLDALSYLHSHTICHLDCRVSCSTVCVTRATSVSASQPDNVVVHVSQGKETVKLVDFGAARYFGTSRDNLPLEHSYESPTSYQYLPPEVFQHQPLGPTADIWYLCVVLVVTDSIQFSFLPGLLG